MSLNPLKKSDLGKDWLSKRRDKRRDIHPEYHLIVTEGTKTEPAYFEKIKEIINKKFRERIQLEIYGEGDNTVNLFERAKCRAEGNPNGYKHIWIVYDTDDFPRENIDAVPELCRQYSTVERQYHAIWSNQCIELWFLLHFSFMHSDLHRKDYFPKLNECLKTIFAGAYEKNREDMFDVLYPYIDIAVANAKKLDAINGDNPPSRSAPGTKVFELVEKMRPYI